MWSLAGVEIVIDTWPWIPSFIEVEGESEELVRKIASNLGCDWSTALHGSVEIVYQHYYNVSEQDIYNWSEIVFSPVPQWLESKRK